MLILQAASPPQAVDLLLVLVLAFWEGNQLEECQAARLQDIAGPCLEQEEASLPL